MNASLPFCLLPSRAWRVSVCTLALLVLQACSTAPRPVPKPFVPEVLSPADRLSAFDEVANRIQNDYVDPKHNGVDWRGVTERYRERVLQAPSDAKFWEELQFMVGELRDAHSRVLSPTDQKATREQRGVLGVELRPHEGRWWLTQVSPVSQAHLLGLRPGVEVLEVDGRPTAAWWAEQARAVRGSSTERSQTVLVNARLNNGEVGTLRTLTVRDAAGQTNTYALRLEPLSSAVVRAHLLNDGTGYLRLAAFTPLARTELDHALRRLQPAKRLVLDLRSNPGGAMAMTVELLSWFLPPGLAGEVITRDNRRLKALMGLLDVTPELKIEARAGRFEQPLAVLIDERSASASEFTSAVLQGRQRARVFGSTSCGCLLAVRNGEELAGGGRLIFSEVDVRIQGQPRIEGVGVVPDEPVWADPAGLVRGFDAVWQAARRWLDTQVRP